MIQRIQSVFLFLAGLVSLVISNIVDLWKAGTEWMQVDDYKYIFAMFMSSGILSFIVIFLYKNRKRQLIYNYLNIVLNLVLVGLLAYNLFNLPVIPPTLNSKLYLINCKSIVFFYSYIRIEKDN